MKEVTVRTLTCPPTRAPYDPGEVTSCAPSVAYGLGATRRRRLCSAFTPLSFPCFDQIVKLAVHASEYKFGSSSPTLVLV